MLEDFSGFITQMKSVQRTCQRLRDLSSGVSKDILNGKIDYRGKMIGLLFITPENVQKLYNTCMRNTILMGKIEVDHLKKIETSSMFEVCHNCPREVK